MSTYHNQVLFTIAESLGTAVLCGVWSRHEALAFVVLVDRDVKDKVSQRFGSYDAALRHFEKLLETELERI